MPMYKEFNPDTGEILATLIIPEASAEYAIKHGQHLILDEYQNAEYQTHYVDVQEHKIKLRPPQNTVQNKNEIIADGEDFILLSNLPKPCKVYFNEHVYDVDDGGLQWSTFTPMIYKISVKAFPFLDFEGSVNAVESYTQSGA